MSKNYIVGIIALLIVVFIGWQIFANSGSSVSSTSTNGGSLNAMSGSGSVTYSNNSDAQRVAEIILTDNGFGPSPVTIKQGQTVNFTNQSSGPMWVDSKFNDGWLFVDGTLNTKSQNVLESSNIAGIVKSHGVYYFPFEKMCELYSMEKGQRSSVFQPYDKTGKKKDIFTWYLRLHHDKRNGVNDFGIVRVEIPAKKELISKVDEISSWILLETKPVGFPASRWDRMIYPIKYCEDYLKSKAPSWTMIESLS